MSIWRSEGLNSLEKYVTDESIKQTYLDANLTWLGIILLYPLNYLDINTTLDQPFVEDRSYA